MKPHVLDHAGRRVGAARAGAVEGADATPTVDLLLSVALQRAATGAVDALIPCGAAAAAGVRGRALVAARAACLALEVVAALGAVGAAAPGGQLALLDAEADAAARAARLATVLLDALARGAGLAGAIARLVATHARGAHARGAVAGAGALW